MKRFIVFTCLLVATASCASIAKDFESVDQNIKKSENVLSNLALQIADYSASPLFKNEEVPRKFYNLKENF